MSFHYSPRLVEVALTCGACGDVKEKLLHRKAQQGGASACGDKQV